MEIIFLEKEQNILSFDYGLLYPVTLTYNNNRMKLLYIINVFSECIGLQDPYCAFDKVNKKCRSMREVPSSRWHEFYQNIQTGLHHECPSGS